MNASEDNSKQPSIAIVGGGLSGLAAAHRLRQLQPEARVVLFESAGQLGGVLKTDSIGGYLVENSADMFTVEPENALRFCQQIGRDNELISTQPVLQRAFIATPTGIAPVPHGLSLMLPNDLQAVVDSKILDDAGAKRFLAERGVPARHESTDESFESFAVRRFGLQVFERIFQPLVGGIYTADPKLLSMQATLSRFLKMEQQHGSLLAAAEAQKKRNDDCDDQLAIADQAASGARYDLFRAPRLGMSQLIGWLVDELKNVVVKIDAPVTQIEKLKRGWRLTVMDSGSEKSADFDGLILTTPANQTSQLLNQMDGEIARSIGDIDGASCAIVALGFDQKQIERTFSGYGIVVPSYLKRKLIAASFSSNKFAGRAPAGKVLIRAFIGGALQAPLIDLPDDELQQIAVGELNDWLGIDGAPELARVFRWRTTMPQYHIGHVERVARIEAGVKDHAGLEIAGNSYHGVGIPACILNGQQSAQRMHHYLIECQNSAR